MSIWPFGHFDAVAKSFLNKINGFDLAIWLFGHRLCNNLNLQSFVFGHLATLKGVFSWPNKMANETLFAFRAEPVAERS